MSVKHNRFLDGWKNESDLVKFHSKVEEKASIVPKLFFIVLLMMNTVTASIEIVPINVGQATASISTFLISAQSVKR